MKAIIFSLLGAALCVADTLKLPEVEKAAEPDKIIYDLSGSSTSLASFSFSNKWTVSDGWLTIHPGDDQSWKPEDVLVESKNKPVVTKIGDRWVIRFKN